MNRIFPRIAHSVPPYARSEYCTDRNYFFTISNKRAEKDIFFSSSFFHSEEKVKRIVQFKHKILKLVLQNWVEIIISFELTNKHTFHQLDEA